MEGGEVRTFTKRGKLKKQKKVKKPKGVGPQTFIKKIEVIPKNEIVEPPKKRGRPPKISIVLPPDEPPPPPKQKKGTYTRLTPGEDWRPGTFETLKEYNERQARRLGPGFKKAIDGFNALQKEFKRKQLVKLSKFSSSNITPEEVEKATSTEQMNKLYIQNLAGVDIDKLKKQGVEVDTNEVLAELGKTAKKPKKPKSSRSKSLERKEPRAERSSVEALDLAPQPKKRGRPKKATPPPLPPRPPRSIKKVELIAPLEVPTLERSSSSSKKSPRTPKQDLPSPRGEKPHPEIPTMPTPTPPAKKRPPMPKSIARVTPVEAKKEKLLQEIKEDAPVKLVPLVNEVIKLDKKDETEHDRFAALLAATKGVNEEELNKIGRSESRKSTSRARPAEKHEEELAKLRRKSQSRARSEIEIIPSSNLAVMSVLEDIFNRVETQINKNESVKSQKQTEEILAYLKLVEALAKENKKMRIKQSVLKYARELKDEDLANKIKQYNSAVAIQSAVRGSKAKQIKAELKQDKLVSDFFKQQRRNELEDVLSKSNLTPKKTRGRPSKKVLSVDLEKTLSRKELLADKQAKVKEIKELEQRLKESKAKRLGGLSQPEKVKLRAERTELTTFIQAKRQQLKEAEESTKELESMADISKLKEEADKAQTKAEKYTELQEENAKKTSGGKKVPKFAKSKEEREEERTRLEAERKRAEKLQQDAKEARAKLLAAELEVEKKSRELAEKKAEEKAREAQQAFITRRNELKTEKEAAEKAEREKEKAEREGKRNEIIEKAEQSAAEAKKALAEKRRQERENPELVKSKQAAEAKRMAKLKEEWDKIEEFKLKKEQTESYLKIKGTLVKAYYETTPEIAERINKYLQRLGIESISEFAKLPEELKDVVSTYVKQKVSYTRPSEDLEELKSQVNKYYSIKRKEQETQAKFDALHKKREEAEIKEQARKERREIEKELTKIYGDNPIKLTPEQRTEYDRFKKMKPSMNEFEKRQAKFNAMARIIHSSGNKDELLEEIRAEQEAKAKKAKALLVPKSPSTLSKAQERAKDKAEQAKAEEEAYAYDLPKSFLRRLPKAITEEEEEEELTAEQKEQNAREEQRAELERIETERKEREIGLKQKAAEKLRPTGEGLPYGRAMGMGDLSDGDNSSDDGGGSDHENEKKISHNYIMPSSPMIRRGFQHPAMESATPAQSFHPNAYANIHASHGGLLKSDLESMYHKAVPKSLRPAVEDLAKDTGMYAMRSKPVQKAKRKVEGAYKKIVPKSLRGAVEDLGKDTLDYAGRRTGYGKGMSRSRSSSPSSSPERGGSLGCSVKSKLMGAYKKAIPKSLRPAVAELAKDTARYAVNTKPVRKLRQQAKEGYEKAVPKSLRPAVKELAEDAGDFAKRQAGFGLKKGSEEARAFMAALRARRGKKMKGGRIPAPPSRSPITDPSLL